jgi:phenylalanyl-tRNA synthetase beta chain
MRILERWLKRYASFSFSPADLAEKLTMLGLEFESVERLDAPYAGFVVGEVLSREKHPQADRLSVCSVLAGRERLSIVCGAPNVAPGQKVVVGLPGAMIPRPGHQGAVGPEVLRKTTIRGVESEGMICSEYELNLGKNQEEILTLGDDAISGQSLASYYDLDDTAFDIEITPNRPDWLSHFGVAREIAVLTGRLPRLPVPVTKEGNEKITRHLSIQVLDPENCPRFAARMIRGLKIGPSPLWLQNAIRNVGLRPRNNVVDITNFVMYECGQPMHAFDYESLKGGQIIVRPAQRGLIFATLDGVSRNIPEGALMVCDAEKEVSIAGIMGGENSEITDATVDVVLEAAYWNPASIRRSSKLLGISTDASQRFERGADPGILHYTLNRAAALILETAGGTLLRGIIDVYPRKMRERKVPLRVERLNALLGTEMRKGEVIRSLGKLGIRRDTGKKEELRFVIPTFRVDIEREIDLIEEVARVYGYDKIEEKTSGSFPGVTSGNGFQIRDSIRNALVGRGFQEAITNSMLPERETRGLGIEPVAILNPQSQEMGTLRTSLIPGLLAVVARNQNVGNANLRLFEIGHVFRVEKEGAPGQIEDFLEEDRVCFLMTGEVAPLHWSMGSRSCDLFDVKGEVEDLITKFALDKSRFISYSTSNGLTDDTLTIDIQGSYAGHLGQVRREVLLRYEIERPVFVAELSVDSFKKTGARTFSPLSRYPKVRRDVAFIVDEQIPAEHLERTIKEMGGELLQSAELFDVYTGNPLPQGKKSVAFALEVMSPLKTLTDAEIEGVVRRVVAGVERTHGATLRSTR